MSVNLYPAQLQLTSGAFFPLGSIYCIGRNYRAHAAEMKAEIPAEPLVFLKPSSAIVPCGGAVQLPAFSSLIHYEVELVVVMGREAVNVDTTQALASILGFAVGIDLTLRDVQDVAKKKGEPWAVAKGFRGSAPLSKIVPIDAVSDLNSLQIRLCVNGTEKQRGSVPEMERSIPELICYLSKVFGLRAGDCVFTGTPQGVGAVAAGDTLTAELVGLAELSVTVR